MVLTSNEINMKIFMRSYKNTTLGNKRLYSSTTVDVLKTTIILEEFEKYKIPPYAYDFYQCYDDWHFQCKDLLENVNAEETERIRFYVEQYCKLIIKSERFKCYTLEVKAYNRVPPFKLKNLEDCDKLLNKQQQNILEKIYKKYNLNSSTIKAYDCRYMFPFNKPVSDKFKLIDYRLKLILYFYDNNEEFEQYADMFCRTFLKILKKI